MSDMTIMCVDDENYIIESIQDYLSPDFSCIAYENPNKALSYLRDHKVEILITDFRMPDINGLDLLKEARGLEAYTAGFLLTAYADKDLLKNMLNEGLVNKVLEKPLDLRSLKSEIDHAAEKIRALREKQEKLEDIIHTISSDEGLDFCFIGKEGDLAGLWRETVLAAGTRENILITGETGTGKDVLARQIHSLSSRRNKPFIKINCGALPSSLIESELFGYEKGAFSGADRKKFGKIELAHEGTLFLDEIGELPAELQSKLLHVVEDKILERIGGTERIAVDFRLISATNKSLDVLRQEEFRRDLFFRISTIHLKLPALRERKKDLPLHIDYLMRKNNRLFGKPKLSISNAAVEFLCAYGWPGNIREMDNIVKRAILLSGDETSVLDVKNFSTLLHPSAECGVCAFSDAVTRAAEEVMNKGCSLQSIEEAILDKLVDLCDGRIMEAARRTEIPKDRFYRRKVKNTS